MISKHNNVNALIDRATKLAIFPINILLHGESGTGKEVFAEYIHKCYSEANDLKGRFVGINCAAMPEHLLESELFGYKKGAFTGASRSRDGLLCSAKYGTVLLDEIGDMPLLLQAKLLRAIETGKVRALGSDREVEFKARIISATNMDLMERIKDGSFREDLYYRLSTTTLELIPLRNRPKDIPDLAMLFAQQAVEEFNLNITEITITDRVYEILLTHTWPGNIRELKNVITGAVAEAYTGNDRLIIDDVPLIRHRNYDHARNIFTWSLEDNGPDIKVAVSLLEEYILTSLVKKYGSVYKAANKAGIAYPTARRKCELKTN